MNNNCDSGYGFALCYAVTGVLNGLKKIVGKGTPEVDENHLITSTPDFSTPCVKSGKKRKASEGSSAFSSKKKFVQFYLFVSWLQICVGFAFVNMICCMCL
jgi:hypothetical protein